MTKVKYQGGITKLITTKIGKRNKEKFHNLVTSPPGLNTLLGTIDHKGQVDLDVVSFSSSSDFNEQVLSILSFIRYVGIPASWTVYSDGSHKSEQIRLLQASLAFVKVSALDFLNDQELSRITKDTLRPWLKELQHFAQKFPWGKKLFYNLNHCILRPTLLIDSDIMFYDMAPVLIHRLDRQENGYYLPDINWGILDSRFLAGRSPQLYQVNSGFCILHKELQQVKEGLSFLRQLNGQYEYFTEQTVVHILLTENNFVPLDPRIFILDTADQFDFSYLHSPARIALRHYTGPVRHKMWQRDWKWQLSIS